MREKGMPSFDKLRNLEKIKQSESKPQTEVVMFENSNENRLNISHTNLLRKSRASTTGLFPMSSQTAGGPLDPFADKRASSQKSQNTFGDGQAII